mmetsp:Transcript_184714/g.585925  ORF Transcript_184714/g.585925 Transcript_184714/m.585925 type:complete len:86 (+) Transcript_184714:233-490(+)
MVGKKIIETRWIDVETHGYCRSSLDFNESEQKQHRIYTSTEQVEDHCIDQREARFPQVQIGHHWWLHEHPGELRLDICLATSRMD